ncbi:hemerythrin domain-containing protein [Roseateles cavernae]|uniref:hemerythrin domain-containing protein n=1 Tax=Roseateles cavernae TaxID=3153578 RepID=UPI0032E436C3
MRIAPQPGSSYQQPFELLAACHERVERSLSLLTRLCEHLTTAGPDAVARDAARDVLRYFDIAAPLHHQDEELHVFPALASDAVLAPVCRRLLAQHREIEAQWQPLRALLQALDPAELAALRRAAEAFARLHDEHLRSENELVFPAARALLGEAQAQAMGIEMAARRGLTLTE